jgi:CheY-like chemotaxis protein
MVDQERIFKLVPFFCIISIYLQVEKMTRNILIVDDEQVIHDVVRDVLEYKGYEVASVYNGLDALKIIKETQPDLIILDINLPKISGCALSTLLAEDEKTNVIPIIFLTGFINQKEAEELGNTFSGQHLLTKPFDIDDLIALVEKIFNSH